MTSQLKRRTSSLSTATHSSSATSSSRYQDMNSLTSSSSSPTIRIKLSKKKHHHQSKRRKKQASELQRDPSNHYHQHFHHHHYHNNSLSRSNTRVRAKQQHHDGYIHTQQMVHSTLPRKPIHTLKSLENLNKQEFGDSRLMLTRKKSFQIASSSRKKKCFLYKIFHSEGKTGPKMNREDLLQSVSADIGDTGPKIDHRINDREYRVKAVQLLNVRPVPRVRSTKKPRPNSLGKNQISMPLKVTKHKGIGNIGHGEVLSIKSKRSAASLRPRNSTRHPRPVAFQKNLETSEDSPIASLDTIDKRLDRIQRDLDETKQMKRRYSSRTSKRSHTPLDSIKMSRSSSTATSTISERSFISLTSAIQHPELNPDVLIKRSDLYKKNPKKYNQPHMTRAPSTRRISRMDLDASDQNIEQALKFVNTWSEYLRRAIAVRVVLRKESEQPIQEEEEEDGWQVKNRDDSDADGNDQRSISSYSSRASSSKEIPDIPRRYHIHTASQVSDHNSPDLQHQRFSQYSKVSPSQQQRYSQYDTQFQRHQSQSSLSSYRPTSRPSPSQPGMVRKVSDVSEHLRSASSIRMELVRGQTSAKYATLMSPPTGAILPVTREEAATPARETQPEIVAEDGWKLREMSSSDDSPSHNMAPPSPEQLPAADVATTITTTSINIPPSQGISDLTTSGPVQNQAYNMTDKLLKDMVQEMETMQNRSQNPRDSGSSGWGLPSNPPPSQTQPSRSNYVLGSETQSDWPVVIIPRRPLSMLSTRSSESFESRSSGSSTSSITRGRPNRPKRPASLIGPPSMASLRSSEMGSSSSLGSFGFRPVTGPPGVGFSVTSPGFGSGTSLNSGELNTTWVTME